MANQTQTAMDSFNAPSNRTIDQDCGFEYGIDSYRCLFAEYRLSTIKTPFFMIGDQNDWYQMYNDLGHKNISDFKTFSQDEINYVETFSRRTFDAFNAEIDLPHEKSSHGIEFYSMLYSVSCGEHAVSMTDKFWTQKSFVGMSQNDMLKEFINQFDGKTADPTHLRIVDDCTGIMCSASCTP